MWPDASTRRKGRFCLPGRASALLLLLFLGLSGVFVPHARANESLEEPQDVNGDLIPDLIEMSPHFLSWGPNTSGPFFTGTAEVEPEGSFFYEPYWFDYSMPGLGITTLSMAQRLSIGMTKNWEFDISIPVIMNSAAAPSAPLGQQAGTTGMGDTLVWIKRQLTDDADPYKFWSRPAMTLEGQLTLPTGHYLSLNPALYGTDQTGQGSYNEGVYFILRKHFKPFMWYVQAGDIVIDPTDAGTGYAFYNEATTSGPTHVVNGNLLYFASALEHVVNTKWGAGYLFEIFGESQTGQSLLFGPASAPPWSFLWGAPEIEVTWPYEGTVTVTWGAGVALPLYESNYPVTYTPMGTITVYYNGPFGYRGE
jgi:hypothetical protein